MGVWDAYTARLEVQGQSLREASLQRERSLINRKIKDSGSYHQVKLDGKETKVAIINSDNLDEKTIIGLNGEIIDCGSDCEWMGNHWIVTATDANNEVYSKGYMQQCNYLLKWIDPDDKQIHQQWCIVSDGTKSDMAWRMGNFA